MAVRLGSRTFTSRNAILTYARDIMRSYALTKEVTDPDEVKFLQDLYVAARLVDEPCCNLPPPARFFIGLADSLRQGAQTIYGMTPEGRHKSFPGGLVEATRRAIDSTKKELTEEEQEELDEKREYKKLRPLVKDG